MFVWVCAYECVLEQKGQADATLFEQQQLPSSQQARELSRKPVTSSQSILSDLYNKPFNGLTRPLEDLFLKSYRTFFSLSYA